MISVFITEDHELYLEGLALLLTKQGINITGTSLTGWELLKQLPVIHTDILLLDVNLPDIRDEQLIRTIREIKPEQKVIYLTLLRGTRNLHRLWKYNIQGYVLKTASVEELHGAIRTVYDGGVYFSKDIDIRADNSSVGSVVPGNKHLKEALTKREIEVLKLVCKEYSNARIAEELFLSVSTIETHRKNLIAKLGVNNTVGLVKYALKNKLID